jgi:predicted dehydrogenase
VSFMGPAESVCASVQQLGSQLANGDTLAILARFRSGGHSLISAILATPFDGRVAVYGSKGWAEVRDKAHPEAPQGWTLTTALRGEPKRSIDYPPAPAVLANLEAFADAIEGRASYPVPHDQMIATVSALEAIVKSTRSGAVEAVAS